MSDVDRALALYQAFAAGGDEETLQYLVVEGDPPSKARPRFGRNGHTYTPAKQRQQEALLQRHLADAFPDPRDGNLMIGCIFYRRTYQRVDVDNMLKHVLDSANEIIWHDDVQVTAIAGIVEHDPERPRTVIVVGAHESTMLRSGIPGGTRRWTCVICGTAFARGGAAAIKRPPQTCSRACRSVQHERDRARIRCARCGTEVVRRNAGQRYCSRACSASQARRRPPDADQEPWPTCADCGRRVSRREYLRCSDCSPKGRPRKTQQSLAL